MISSAVSSYLHQPVTPPGVNPAQSADAASSPDFAALVSRFYSSSLSVAALTQSVQIPDTSQTPVADAPREDDPAPPVRDTRNDTRPKRSDPAASADAQPASAPAQPDRTTAPPTTTAQRGADDPKPKRPDAPSASPQGQAQQPADGRVATPSGHGAAHPAADSTQQAPQPKNVTAPQQPIQPQTQQAQNGNGGVPKAQIVDNSPKDSLPTLGHLLSSRTAVAAQTDAGKTSGPADNGAAPKNDSTQQAAASVLTGAAQSTAGAAAKTKTQTRVGAVNKNSHGANGSKPGQTTGQTAGQQAVQPAPQAAAVTPQQSGLGNALPGKSGGTDETATQSAQTGSSDQLSFTASAQPGQQTAPRATQAAAPPKPPTPVPPRVIANQVAVQIQKAVGDGNDRISIQLKPAELGKIDVKLDVGSDGRVSAVITAHRADTLDLLQRDARILQNALQDAGLQADANSLSFQLQGNGAGYAGDGGNSRTTGGHGAAAIGDVTAAGPTTAQARPGIVSNDRVDIQV